MRICLILLFFCLNVTGDDNIDSLKGLFKPEQISVLLDLAWDEGISLHERKKYALKALRLSKNVGNKSGQLEALKALSVISQKSNANTDTEMYIRETLLLAKKTNDSQALSTAYNNLGFFFHRLNVYDSALLYYQLAKDLFGTQGLQLNKAQNQVNIGIIYKNLGLYHDAIKSSLSAIAIIEKEHDTVSLVSAYNNIANSLKELREYKNAEYYLLKAVSFKHSFSDGRARASILNNLGNVYRDWGKIDKALSAYTESLEIKEQLGDSILIASTLDNLGEIHFLLNDFSLAELLFKRALSLRIEKGYSVGILTSYNRLAKFAIEHISIDSAEYFVNEALKLSVKNKIRDEELESYRLLKLINERRGNYKLSLHYADKYSQLYKSIFEENKVKAASNLEIKYRTKQYIQDLELSQERENLQMMKVKNQKFVILIFIFAFIALIISIIFISKSLRIKKKVAAIEIALRKELHHRIKNILSLLSGMHGLQIYQEHHPHVKTILQENENRINALLLLHQVLTREGVTEPVNMNTYIKILWENIKSTYWSHDDRIQIEFKVFNGKVSPDFANIIGLIINEILTNAFKYSFSNNKTPSVKIVLDIYKNKKYLLVLSHSGVLWDYIEGKNKVGSFGLKLIEMLIKQVNAESKVETSAATTTYNILIPIFSHSTDAIT